MKYLAIFLFITAGVAVPWRKSEVAQPKESDIDYYRLPTNIVPIHYDITLTPFLDVFDFDGYEIIIVEVREATDVIILSARDANPFSVSVLGNNSAFNDVEFQGNATTQQLTIYLNEELVVGNQYSIIISYWGLLNYELYGFYRTSYLNEDGDRVRLATTHFEPVTARRAFPSFDEPEYKATFTIRIYRNPDVTSISNLPLISTEGPFADHGGRYLDTFETSERMSTYLVAFIVSDFEYISNPDNTFRVFARPDAINSGQAQYGLDVGIAALGTLESLIGINYTLPKLDQVAIPDLSPGAMENWGLVTYREPYLLWSADTATTSSQQLVATIIAHEFAHQWFGNLVTPVWWDAIWLNEGFATYFEFYVTNQIDVDQENTWQLDDQFATYFLQYALGPDSLDSTRPMTFIGSIDPADIDDVFDVIAYDKSGSVIRMAENFLTTPVFFRGLNYYLNENAFGNVVPDDLFRNWQLAVDEEENGIVGSILPEDLTVTDILNSWTLQKGYPLITVSVNENSGNLVYTQERFIRNNVSSDQTTLWYVPINLATSANPDFDDTRATFWLRDRTGEDSSQNTLDFNWYIVNKRQTGYYRVNYPLSNWQALSNYINDPDTYATVHRVNRAQIIDDSFNLAVAGVVPYDVPLDISNYLQYETEYVPLYAFQNALNAFWRIVPNLEQSDRLEEYLSTLFENSFDYFGIEELAEDSHTDKLARVIVVRNACRLGLPACLDATAERAQRYLEDPEDIPPIDLRSVVYCGALRGGSEELFNYLLDVYIDTPDVDTATRNAIISALGCSSNVDSLNQFLELSLDPNGVIKTGDRQAAFRSVYSGSTENVQVALDFLTSHEVYRFDAAYQVDGFNSVLSGLADVIYNQDQLQQYQAYADSITGPRYSSIALNAADATRDYLAGSESRVSQVNSWVERQLG